MDVYSGNLTKDDRKTFAAYGWQNGAMCKLEVLMIQMGLLTLTAEIMLGVRGVKGFPSVISPFFLEPTAVLPPSAVFWCLCGAVG